jgi:hypothetical protein
MSVFKKPTPEPPPNTLPLPQPLRPSPMVGELRGLPSSTRGS